MFCDKCGQSNKNSDEFCRTCGEELKQSDISSKNQDTSRLKQKFPGLTSVMYEHPEDAKTLQLLKNIPVMSELLKKFYQHWHNLNYEVTLTANSVKVTRNHFPEIYDLFRECAEILDLKKLPGFYITQSPAIGSHVTGAEDTFLIINSALIDLMSKEELCFIIGHEMGHIKSNHVLYQDLANWIKKIVTTVGTITLGVGDIIGAGLMTAITNWLKKSTFTADRSGLLTCQDIDVATVALIKKALGSKKLFSQINIKEYIRQGEDLEAEESKSTAFKAAKMMQNLTQNKPFTTTRVRLLKEWFNSREYYYIIDGHYLDGYSGQKTDDLDSEQLKNKKIKAPRCPACQAGVEAEDDNCKLCGHKLFKAPPICPECFRDLKPHWTICPNCNKRLVPSDATAWIKNKYNRARGFFSKNKDKDS